MIAIALPIMAFVYMYLSQAYSAILLCILFFGFAKIVLKHEKYRFMVDAIERFF